MSGPDATDGEVEDDFDDEFDEDFGALPPPAAPVFAEAAEGFRSGFACFVGRPNVGKSTLTNAVVGQKVVITSDKPQTTRTVVRGIVHRPDGQLVLVDTPGLHRPRTLLGERLNDLVKTTWAEVDVVAVCFPADEKIGPGDTFLVNELAKVRRTTKIAIATKSDLVDPERMGQHLLDIAELGRSTGTDWAEIVPVSSVAGDQIDLLSELLAHEEELARGRTAGETVLDLERDLLRPEVRADPGRLGQLLHEAFAEVGQSEFLDHRRHYPSSPLRELGRPRARSTPSSIRSRSGR